ncbi:cation:proton antiporter [Streptomyces sodiiphilus]|uniref:Cation:proton antiporter n=1 Tax=Streptomyces sodiiphilus TaxID=226217 RepID=A0ABN2PT88_9ACTN
MGGLDLGVHLLHTGAALSVVLFIAAAGGRTARLMHQPRVIGEIIAGLLAGPAVIFLFGEETFHVLLPGTVLDVLTLIGQTGLILFLVGLAHKLRTGSGSPSRGTVWTAAGALVAPLLSGVLLVCWIVATDDAAVRGNAPFLAFLLIVAVAMSITAVPVLARILTDRGISETAAGQAALGSAVVIDVVGWVLLTVAIGLGTGDHTSSMHSARALLTGVVCALAIRYILRLDAARVMCRRLPRGTAVLLAAAALGVAFTVEHMGMTSILGAALVGLAVPGGPDAPWGRAVTAVSRFGRALIPAFFVVTGITVLQQAFASVSWMLVGLTVLLGCAGKGLGGYAGARLGGHAPGAAARVGVLMNTRGLTELIVLQAGYEAGLLAAPLVLALIVMALATTVMTGPLLDLLDSKAGHPDAGSAPAETESGIR